MKNDYFGFLEDEAAQAEWEARLDEARATHWNVPGDDDQPVWMQNYVDRSRRLIGVEPQDYQI